LKTNEYKRIKIGISNNENIDMKDYVLSKINDNDMKKIRNVISLSTDIIKDYLNLSFDNLMNKYN
jgi:peptidyl-tRNA hydrolase